ncbi:hypothetical protein [Gracilibacillus thailandensis]|uniref:hypothetical protein n=1 Tax=Gracilibacillus thailandensis TaxID=563735 RepID=UPI0013D69E24|nr:hypothetical protein [Gracilibacillus thailandensis]
MSWFMFLILLVIDYVECYNFKKFEQKPKSKMFYIFGIILFSIFTLISILGMIELIYIEETHNIVPNKDFILVESLFLLLFGYNLTVNIFLVIIATSYVVFSIGELFCKPVLSYKQKHNMKQEHNMKKKHMKQKRLAGEELTSDTN